MITEAWAGNWADYRCRKKKKGGCSVEYRSLSPERGIQQDIACHSPPSAMFAKLANNWYTANKVSRIHS
jgi:hypothetical protein